MRRLGLITTLTALFGCTGDIGVNTDDAAIEGNALAVWTLEADATLALRDARRPMVAYPNPAECDSLTVAVGESGVIGICNRAGLRIVRRGGPDNGVPYTLSPYLKNDKVFVRVRDLFGLEVTTLPLEDGCVSQGHCRVCADEEGGIAADSCGALDEDGPLDSGDDDPDAESPVPPSSGGTTPPDTCEQLGAQAYIDTLNANLAAIGLPDSGLTLDEVTFGNGELGDWELWGESCASIRDDDEDDDHAAEHPEDFVRDGDLRCAYMGEELVPMTCDRATPQGCERAPFDSGIFAAHRAWEMGAALRDSEGLEELLDEYFAEGAPSDSGGSHDGPTSPELPDVNPNLPECVSSPLVLAGASFGPLQLSSLHDGVGFDLLGRGRAVRTGWVKNGGVLALDLDADGAITSGRELFGDGTRLASGRLAAHGFAALAQYDALALGGNEDGFIDASDEVFERLDVWADRDHDGVTDPGELTSAVAAGLEAIELGWVETHARQQGNILGLEGAFVMDGGLIGTVYDVWFAYSAAPPES